MAMGRPVCHLLDLLVLLGLGGATKEEPADEFARMTAGREAESGGAQRTRPHG